MVSNLLLINSLKYDLNKLFEMSTKNVQYNFITYDGLIYHISMHISFSICAVKLKQTKEKKIIKSIVVA